MSLPVADFEKRGLGHQKNVDLDPYRPELVKKGSYRLNLWGIGAKMY